jgi:Nif-specific regulatory protein
MLSKHWDVVLTIPQGWLHEQYDFKNIIGSSGSMKEVFEVIQKITDTDVTVLVIGESGTGKELIAQAIHYHSSRKSLPFVKLNCVAIPDGLLESELFGHEKGAFTGAVDQRIGKFELANSGTIFLDEIGDMSLTTQAKILRVLQEREFERVGGAETVRIDTRVIAATNRDLSKAVGEGKFREDLYFRLNVVTIFVPAFELVNVLQELAFFNGSLDDGVHFIHAKRLGEIVVRAGLQAPRSECGHQDDDRHGVNLFDRRDE